MSEYFDYLRELVAKYNKNQDDHLTRDELIPIMTEFLGYDATPYVNEVLLLSDMDGTGTINNLQELDTAMKKTGAIKLKTIFKKYDKDGKFGLSKEELTPLLEEMLGFPPREIVDEVMQAGDQNGSGTIDTMWELQVALTKTKAIKASTLREEFENYDGMDCSDGFVTKEDLERVTEFMSDSEKEQVESPFMKADVNGDGKVSLEEYMRHMMKE